MLSGIACFAMIIVVTVCLFDKLKYKLIALRLTLVALLSIFLFGVYKNSIE